MKRYLIPLLVLCFIVFGITTGTSYAAESQATQSTNITATEEASQTASKEASSANIESTNKPLSLESNNVSHNEQATPSSETTTHLVLKRLQHKTLLQRSIVIHHKVLPFHKKSYT